ncbi:hypothetical protein EG835_08910, partial [bacterium]|nr:hypothetical protein [bacterium]
GRSSGRSGDGLGRSGGRDQRGRRRRWHARRLPGPGRGDGRRDGSGRRAGRLRFRAGGPLRVEPGSQLAEVPLQSRIRPLQLARAFLELRQAALRDEGDDERHDGRQNEHRRQQEEEGLHSGVPHATAGVTPRGVLRRRRRPRRRTSPRTAGYSSSVIRPGRRNRGRRRGRIWGTSPAPPVRRSARNARRLRQRQLRLHSRGSCRHHSPRVWYHSRLCGRLVAM